MERPLQLPTEIFWMEIFLCHLLWYNLKVIYKKKSNFNSKISKMVNFGQFRSILVNSRQFLSFWVSLAHSQIWPYVISYLLTCEVDFFEVLEIMTQMWHYMIFLSHKPTKVTSGFILNNLKKSYWGRHHSEKFKNKY